ncbi:hypothetical protein BCV69DRAFT_116696 [Microstroma glucosiphilum]|uniref:Uncharacterized protein n=1 Tax=Pseudomicrostroma glucosiphilum TaxID=1684307 RepID=A0A316UDS8_9BASI|nr:hypothetical protein BCV69DRAFT_116696 [Pseudomicrostroma glucosiphilum]PWN23350.1 hypothetical protein BCV69DRAFT_116696 [Pseudomicrostroma glucosiphilum]
MPCSRDPLASWKMSRGFLDMQQRFALPCPPAVMPAPPAGGRGEKRSSVWVWAIPACLPATSEAAACDFLLMMHHSSLRLAAPPSPPTQTLQLFAPAFIPPLP